MTVDVYWSVFISRILDVYYITAWTSKIFIIFSLKIDYLKILLVLKVTSCRFLLQKQIVSNNGGNCQLYFYTSSSNPSILSSFHPSILLSFHSFIHPFFYPFILSSIPSFILSFFHLSILLSFHSFIYPFIISSFHSFIFLILFHPSI